MSTLNQFYREDSGTNTVLTVAEFMHTSTGTPAAGLGSKFALGAENSTGSAVSAVEVQGYLSTVTAGAEDGVYLMQLRRAGALQTAFQVTAGANTTTITSGQTTLNAYNTVATTVNAFGAATVLNIGNASGTNTITGKSIFTHASAYDVLLSRRLQSNVGFGCGLVCQLRDSAAANFEYAAVLGIIENSTVTTRAGALNFYCASADTASTSLAPKMTLASTGNLTMTGAIIGIATQSVFNTVSTTVNAFGAASTAVNMGHASGTITLLGSTAIGSASTNLCTMTSRFLHRSVTDAGPMTATGGTQREIVFNTSNSTFYGCTVTHSSAATWVALH